MIDEGFIIGFPMEVPLDTPINFSLLLVAVDMLWDFWTIPMQQFALEINSLAAGHILLQLVPVPIIPSGLPGSKPSWNLEENELPPTFPHRADALHPSRPLASAGENRAPVSETIEFMHNNCMPKMPHLKTPPVLRCGFSMFMGSAK